MQAWAPLLGRHNGGIGRMHRMHMRAQVSGLAIGSQVADLAWRRSITKLLPLWWPFVQTPYSIHLCQHCCKDEYELVRGWY